MARAGKGSVTTSTTDGERGSTEVSMSPPVTGSPTRTTKPGNTKKRKRGDDAKALKRSKLQQQNGQHDTTSAGDDSDGGEPALDKTHAAVKLEDEDQPMDEDKTDGSGPSLHPVDAERILLVLESVNASNALDAAHTIHGTTASLRQLLSNSSSVSLRALRDRVCEQAPNSALDLHPHRHASTSRAVPKPDSAVVRFYRIAQQLLDDVAASYAGTSYIDTAHTPASPAFDDRDEKTAAVSSSRTNPDSTPAYALYQHLPTGDYFTSAASLSRAELKALPKGQASFLEIHPAPALPPQAFPSLGSYAVSSQTPSVKRPGLGQQRISTAPKPSHAATLSSAAFIDYGVFSSLAPAFDSEGGQIGREALGLVSTFKRERAKKRTEARADVQKALRELATKKLTKLSIKDRVPSVKETTMEEKSDDSTITTGFGKLDLDIDMPPAYAESRETIVSLAGSILGNDQDLLEGVMRTLDECTLDDELSDLVRKNGRALQRLQELQAVRFRAGSKGKEIALAEGSEEWLLGRQLLASLTTIVGLRPRVQDPSSSMSPMSLVPSPVTLHSLQRSVPRDPAPGYRGTLSSTRDFALIDNTTIRPSASALLLPPPPITGSATSAVTNPGTTLPPAPSLGSTTSGQYSYVPRAGATSYGYAGRAAGAGSGTSTPRAQTGANPNAQYYPTSAYHYSQSSPGVMNGGYYNSTSNTSVGAGGTSGGTPYTPVRAVPNLAGKAMNGGVGQWGTTPVGVGGTGGIPGGMALPPHLRNAGSSIGRAPVSPSPYAPGQYTMPGTAPGTPVGAGMNGVAKPNGAAPVTTWGSLTPLR